MLLYKNILLKTLERWSTMVLIFTLILFLLFTFFVYLVLSTAS